MRGRKPQANNFIVARGQIKIAKNGDRVIYRAKQIGKIFMTNPI
jgi:hypothetical protein